MIGWDPPVIDKGLVGVEDPLIELGEGMIA